MYNCTSCNYFVSKHLEQGEIQENFLPRTAKTLIEFEIFSLQDAFSNQDQLYQSSSIKGSLIDVLMRSYVDPVWKSLVYKIH